MNSLNHQRGLRSGSPTRLLSLFVVMLAALALRAVALHHLAASRAAAHLTQPRTSPLPPREDPAVQQARAQRAASEAEKLKPTDLQGMTRLALLYSRAGRFLDAAQQLENTIHRYPHSENPWIALGLLLRSGEFRDRAMEAFTRATEVAPHSWRPLLELADMETDLGWSQRAIVHAERAAALAPSETAVLIALSYAYFQAALWSKADEATRRAIKLSPNDAHLWLLLGQVDSYYGMILYQQAEDALNKALQLGGPTPEVLEALGNLEMKWVRPGHLDRAAGYYKQELSLSPRALQAVMALANIDAQTGHYKEGIALLEPLLKDPRRQPPGLKLKLGQLYVRDGQGAKGRALIDQFQKSTHADDDRASIRIAMVPNDPTAHFKQGIDLLKHGAIGYSVVELREANRLAPRNRQYRDALIFALLKQGRQGDAARLLHGLPLVDITQLTPIAPVAPEAIVSKSPSPAVSDLRKPRG